MAACDVNLTQDQIAKMNEAVTNVGLKGDRSAAGMEKMLLLWG